ncbi:hypothetical protein A9K97_gp256 [Tokyovirus A1]|uniref:hypothetical protein n=1 Tax=Tokyovirus A1 TaxID=1826170 RepID=UPI0007A95E8A|nr:hypothetical protein A9K97_gp256 [Tokyovirus A1]BAU80095.1 hypothetical protein [Tokyovirus A1]
METFLEPREWSALYLVVEQRLVERKETERWEETLNGKRVAVEETGTFSYLLGTNTRHGPFKIVEKRKHMELESFGTFFNGKLEGEFSQKKYLVSDTEGRSMCPLETMSVYKKGRRETFLLK